jgi:hypothetical protein
MLVPQHYFWKSAKWVRGLLLQSTDEPGWPGHRAGLHVDVRLTAEDGYQAERSYTGSGSAIPQLTVTGSRCGSAYRPLLTDPQPITRSLFILRCRSAPHRKLPFAGVPGTAGRTT